MVGFSCVIFVCGLVNLLLLSWRLIFLAWDLFFFEFCMAYHCLILTSIFCESRMTLSYSNSLAYFDHDLMYVYVELYMIICEFNETI